MNKNWFLYKTSVSTTKTGFLAENRFLDQKPVFLAENQSTVNISCITIGNMSKDVITELSIELWWWGWWCLLLWRALTVLSTEIESRKITTR